MRETILFNNDWRFHEGDIDTSIPVKKAPLYISAKTERAKWGPATIYYRDVPDDYCTTAELNNRDVWDNVTLPHDYVILHTPEEKYNNTLGYLPYNNAWYRRHFTIAEEERGKRFVLHFDGIATNATVYFNGSLMKHNFCGYTPFDVDITDYLRFGQDNVIAVYVNTENHEGWWYEGGGIYRDVFLVKTNRVAIDTYGVYVYPEKKIEDKWDVNIETTVANEDYEDVSVKLVSKICDKDGNVVAKALGEVFVPTKDTATAVYKTEIENPVLWDLDNPYQYKIITEVIKDGEVIDTYETKTGFRTFKADPNEGFFLNDKYVKIKGVCAHSDCGLTGKAVADNVNRYKAELLKEMGANGYRTSHYPQNPAMMDALDDLGFIVMAETRWFDSTDEGKEQLRTLIKRDRNRPSIFFWSMGNEEPFFVNEQGKNIAKALKREVNKLDKTRLVMTAVDRTPEKATVYSELDAVGVNYNLQSYDILHETYPDIPVFSSECCATGSTRGWYYDDCPDKGYISAYDKATTSWFLGREHTWKFMCERKWLLGSFQWAGFEHRGETVWPRLCSQAGAIDLFLQKKDAFYQNQSHWSDKPMIHMLPHWNLKTTFPGEDVMVWAYTNCEEAELVLNGKSYGKVTVEKYGHAQWFVPYEEGEIEVIGYINGKEVCRDGHKTTKAPAKLKLRLENKVTGTGYDVAIITCYTEDEDGLFVPDASPFVEFHTNAKGSIIGTGSDISDHNPVTEKNRKMREGLISVAVAVKAGSGTLSIYAKAEGLTPARLDIEI